MAYGLPQVTLTFAAAVKTAAASSASGRLAMVIRDEGATETVILSATSEAEALAAMDWTDVSERAISQAFLGKPQSLILVVLPSGATLVEGYALLENQRFDVCTVAGLQPEESAAFITWAKNAYDEKRRRALYVAASSVVPDHPAIIHFDTSSILVDDVTYSAYDYLPRIAGALAGLQLWESATYLVLPEVDDCPHLTRSQANAAIATGKLILFHDGEKVKIARGVTSLTTLGTSYTTDFQKAKVVRILNRLEEDIITNIEDNYIGKVPNTFVQKQLLISAISDYLKNMEDVGVLQPGTSSIGIDMAKQRAYLKTKFSASVVDAMDDEQVREMVTEDKLFLSGTIRPADSIEDVAIVFTL